MGNERESAPGGGPNAEVRWEEKGWVDAGQRTDFDRDEESAAILAAPEHQIRQRRIWALSALTWALGLAAVGAATYASWQLWLAWQTGYEPYWQHVGITTPVLFFLAVAYVMSEMMGRFLLGLRGFNRRFRSQNERLRQAAISSDGRLAPTAEEQPEPLPLSELPLGPITFGPFEKVHRKAAHQSLAAHIAFVLIAGGTIVLFIVLDATLPGITDGPFGGMLGPFEVVFLGTFALAGLISLVTLALRVWGRVRGRGQELSGRFVADDWGIREAEGHRGARQPIAWHDTRAFYKADDLLRLNGSHVSEGLSQRTTFTADTGERRLQWSVSTTSSPDQRAASDRLARVIVTHTRLPLRDLSAAVTTQALAMLDLITPFVGPQLGKRFTFQPSPDSSPSRLSSRPIGTPTSRWILASRIVAIALAIVLLAAGSLTQTLQSFHYDDLIHQHIDYQNPYYTIDFRVDDGRWPKHSATPTSGSFTFAADGYHMTGAPDGQPMQAVLGDTYGGATVELTAGLAGVIAPSEYGVVLRENDDGTAKVVFSVSSSGGWALTNCQPDASGVTRSTVLMSNDHSGAVQTGQNAYNFMTVIMRGGDYICLVRDHLVGIYHDSSGQTPRQGHAGIWLGNSRAVGIYYYFSVYPAQ